MASSGRSRVRHRAAAAGAAAIAGALWLAIPAQAKAAPSTTATPGTATTPSASPGASPATSFVRAPTVGAIEVTSKTKDAVLQSSTRAPHDGLAVAGTVSSADGTPASYVPITFSGSNGVYFSTSPGPLTTSPDDDLSQSLVGATTAQGEIPPVYAYFTRSGFNRITISSGAVSHSVTLIAPSATDPYQVSVGSVSGNPGARLVVMGTVLDAFGNPVPGLRNGLNLSVSDPALGTLLTQAPETDAGGMFSTAFRASDTRKGVANLVAKLAGPQPEPDPAWKTDAGITILPGNDEGQATVMVSGRVRFSATQSLLGGGKARLRGTAEPGSVVSIYARPDGWKHSTRIGSVIANAEGNWGIGTTIVTTTSFRARTGGVATSILTTTVQSDQTVQATGLGRGRVEFVVHGQPHVPGVVTIEADGQQLAKATTDEHGTVTTDVHAKPGVHTFRVYFEAPGTRHKSQKVTGTVR